MRTVFFLTATVEALKQQIDNKDGSGSGSGTKVTGTGNPNRRQGDMPLWRFFNKNNEKMMVKDDHNFEWCVNDYHCQCPMWCGLPNCLNKADFRTKKKKEESGQKVGTVVNTGKAYFKIALAAIISPNDLKKYRFFLVVS